MPFLIAEFCRLRILDVPMTIASLFTTCPEHAEDYVRNDGRAGIKRFADGKPVQPSGSWKAQERNSTETRRKLAGVATTFAGNPLPYPTQPITQPNPF